MKISNPVNPLPDKFDHGCNDNRELWLTVQEVYASLAKDPKTWATYLNR